MNRSTYAQFIYERLNPMKGDLRKQFLEGNRISTFIVDDLLPGELAEEAYAAFPPASALVLKKSLKEDKYVGVQMDEYNPLLEEIVYAFQDQKLVSLLEEITEIENMYADPHLYASGLSLMGKGQFLNPHLDNSHDKEQKGYRVLNLLYYVTPGWRFEYGGNLELWDGGLKRTPRVIHSQFNRLVCMATHRTSWHSVQPIRVDEKRSCVSNYYFAPRALETTDEYFHVTSFRGRPGQPMVDFIVRMDGVLRQIARRVLSPKLVRNPHVYKK